MFKKFLTGVLMAGLLMGTGVSYASHIHVFPSIDKPDDDLILIKENFRQDIAEGNKVIFTDGTEGYWLFFYGPGGWTDTATSRELFVYLPAKDGNSKILKLKNKTGPFNVTRAFEKIEYTAKEDKQVPAFLEVLDKCYNETLLEFKK